MSLGIFVVIHSYAAKGRKGGGPPQVTVEEGDTMVLQQFFGGQ